MKKIIVLVLLAALGIGGYFMYLNFTGKKNPLTGSSLQKPDYAYELDTWGTNSEVYEFTSLSDPGTVTVAYMLDSLNAMASFNIPKSLDPKLFHNKKGHISKIQADHAYELDTWNENSEVYEFTPRSRLDWFCQVYILDNLKDMDMNCRPKPTSKDYRETLHLN